MDANSALRINHHGVIPSLRGISRGSIVRPALAMHWCGCELGLNPSH